MSIAFFPIIVKDFPFPPICGALDCNFTKINTPPSVFFTFFKLCKWYQIAQRTTYSEGTNTGTQNQYQLKESYRQKDQRLIELVYIKEIATLISVTLFCAMSFLQERYQLGKK